MRLLATALLLLAMTPAPAQDTVFYKCTDAGGNVSMQNGVPCAPGMKQEVRRIGEVRTVPVPARQAEPAAPPPAPVYGEFIRAGAPPVARTPAPEAAGLPPPPALFECKTWEGDGYLGEVESPPPRCAPLQVVGIDGRPALGMGSACEMKHDACTAVPAEQLCAAWYRRLDDADFKLRYAGEDERGARQAERDTVQAKVKASHCATEVAAGTPAP